MKRRELSSEERDLWALATRDVKPPKKRTAKKRVDPQTPLAGFPKKALRDASFVTRPNRAARQDEPILHPVEPERSGGVAKDESKAPASAKSSQTIGRKNEPAATPKRKAPPVFGGGDPKADRKAAKGLIPIEARLDLHGMTEAAAHARVTRFLLGAHSSGLRLVLVITGKGARAGEERRGVIRARFFDWIETAPLRAAIARVAAAKPKDGGAGAFYVFLKRKTRG